MHHFNGNRKYEETSKLLAEKERNKHKSFILKLPHHMQMMQRDVVFNQIVFKFIVLQWIRVHKVIL